MIGIAVNVLAVVIGGLIGSGLGSRIPEAFMEKIKLAFSVCAVGMGVASIVMMKNMPAVILSVVVGTVLGLIFGLDVLIRRGGTGLGPVISAVAIPQLAVFSLMFVLARLILPVTTPMMIADFKACGGILLIATGLCIAGIKEFPIANMLPAMVLVIPFSWAWTTYLMPLL